MMPTADRETYENEGVLLDIDTLPDGDKRYWIRTGLLSMPFSIDELRLMHELVTALLEEEDG